MFRASLFVACFLFNLTFLGQGLIESRTFAGSRKNFPVAIINNDARHFFVLRYNRDIHDMVLERRRKPGGEIITISPFRMDSVNAPWFNYLNLDYLFFEEQNKVFYVFEKILNNERTLYLKYIDSTGKTGPFIPIHHLSNDKNTTSVKLEYKLTREQMILIVSHRVFWNGSVKKQAMLYDPFSLKVLWSKNLPIENFSTGYSEGFQCTTSGDLYYFLVQSSVVSQKRVYMHNQQVMVPVFYYNRIELKSYLGESEIHTYQVPVKDVWGLYGASVFPIGNDVSLHLHYYSNNDEGKPKVYFFNALTTPALDKFRYELVSPLTPRVDSMLTYYDGSDDKAAAMKTFFLSQHSQVGSTMIFLAERQEEKVRKEGIYYEVDLPTGRVTKQVLLPRKYASYEDIGARRNPGSFHGVRCGGTTYFSVLENRRNSRIIPGAYRHKDFKVQKELGGSLAFYYADSLGLHRKLLEQRQEFVFIPVNYTGRPCEQIIYLYRGKMEKFIILSLEELR